MAVFRFLVNVDSCINMSYCKFLFYELTTPQNNGHSLFHCSEVNMTGADQTQLLSAVSDIRMYLDKYPYEVEDYRVIFLMRCPFTQATQVWEQTMLCRLLRLRHVFSKANLLLSTAKESGRDCAMNLVMLYDSDYPSGLPSLGSYLSSNRLSEDIKQLLAQFGISKTSFSVAELKDALSTAQDHENSGCNDLVAAEILRSYLEHHETNDRLLGQEAVSISTLTEYIRDQLCNYTIYERFINRSDGRDEPLAYVQLAEFINHDTESSDINGAEVVASLSQRCDAAWKQVVADPKALQNRYANMLAKYQAKLKSAQRILEKPTLPTCVNSNIPVLDLPADDAINYEHNKDNTKANDALQSLKKLSKKRVFGSSFQFSWNRTHELLCKVLADLNGDLHRKAQELCDLYAAAMEARKKDASQTAATQYVADPKSSALRFAKEKKAELLTKLQNPSMDISPCFQDSLNAEHKLERAANKIDFYLRCLRISTFANFLLFLVICAGIFVFQYTLLQPYALGALDTAIYYLIYIGIALLLMSLSYQLPRIHYFKQIKETLTTLNGDIENCITSYRNKEKYFFEYINRINQLDCLNRYLALLDDAYARGHTLFDGQRWHLEQVKKHLDMLQYFGGLIDSATIPHSNAETPVIDIQNDGNLRDAADCSLYWPRVKENTP